MSIDVKTAFTGKNVLDATRDLLAQLGVAVHTRTTSPIDPATLDPVSNKAVAAALAKVSELYYAGHVGEESFGGDFATLPGGYKGMLVFAAEASALSRADLSALARALNRLSKCAPVLLVARDGGSFSLALAERIPYARASAPGEKAGRVVMLRRVSIASPHRGHLDILERIAAHGTSTFEDFYRYLLGNVLSVSVLTRQFYREIQNWYFWALKPEHAVRFPNDLADDSDDAKFNRENLIRLVTRLVFTWFMKEKGLVNPDLFDEAFLSKALKHFGDDNTTYYRAILQNLFFATFNQEIPLRGFVDSAVVDKKRHNVKNYFRNARLFAEKDEKKIVSWFNGSPFVNGGLFECLDNVEQDGRTYSWDGFSNHLRSRDGALKSALVPDRLFFSGWTATDLSAEYGDSRSGAAAKVRGIVNILKSYVFTIEENTPLDEDVALDPELLGKVFENLLGCYNPETQTMARNATGSFYTPREIVDYMVAESLKAYLAAKCPEIPKEALDAAVEGKDVTTAPSPSHARAIVRALFGARILDPAYGSGAFPMGVMSAMVDILRRLDPDNRLWYDVVLEQSLAEAGRVAGTRDPKERAELEEQIRRDFDSRVDHPDYTRKLYVIENCIFGGDIQPIAVQISRLRFFITLLCEQTKTADAAKNYGITPLPNLENNFVAANSLVSIDLSGMRELLGEKKIVSLVRELRSVRHQLFLPKTSDRKKRLVEKDEKLRGDIAAAADALYDTQLKAHVALLEKELAKIDAAIASLAPEERLDRVETVEERDLFGAVETRTVAVPSKEKELSRRRRDAAAKIRDIQNDSRKKRLLDNLKRLVSWNPFAYNHSEVFLDPEWMFGVKSGFDVVIGNPPYINIQGLSADEREMYKGAYKTLFKRYDTFGLFTELAVDRLSKTVTSFIMPTVMTTNYSFARLRDYLLEGRHLRRIRYAGGDVFSSATVDTSVYFFEKNPVETIMLEDATDWEHPASREVPFDYFSGFKNVISLSQGENDGIFGKIFADGNMPLDRDYTVFQGIVTGNNDAFIFETEADALAHGVERELLHPLCHGRDIARYGIRNLERRILYLTSDYDIRKYPGAEKWLRRFKEAIEHTRDNDNPWYTLHRPRIQSELDRKEKIFVQNTRNESLPVRIVAALDTAGAYTSQGINIVIPKGDANLRFLLGILNSRLINHLFGTKFLNLAIKADFLKQVRLPRATPAQQGEIAALAGRILAAKKSDSTADTSALESEIDKKVFDLYGLTDEEREIVKGGGK